MSNERGESAVSQHGPRCVLYAAAASARTLDQVWDVRQRFRGDKFRSSLARCISGSYPRRLHFADVLSS